MAARGRTVRQRRTTWTRTINTRRGETRAPRMDVTIVIPVLNERDNLRPLVEEIEAALAPTGREFEVLAVDDGSTDGSREVLRALAREKPWLRAVLFRQNYGQSAAFDAGFRHAAGRFVVTMDADGQN